MPTKCELTKTDIHEQLGRAFMCGHQRLNLLAFEHFSQRLDPSFVSYDAKTKVSVNFRLSCLPEWSHASSVRL